MSFVLARSYIFLVYFQFIYLQCVFFLESYIFCSRCVLCVFYQVTGYHYFYLSKIGCMFCSLRFSNKGSNYFISKWKAILWSNFTRLPMPQTRYNENVILITPHLYVCEWIAFQAVGLNCRKLLQLHILLRNFNYWHWNSQFLKHLTMNPIHANIAIQLANYHHQFSLFICKAF